MSDKKPLPGLHDRPDTGKECNYLAIKMPSGILFGNKCGYAETDDE